MTSLGAKLLGLTGSLPEQALWGAGSGLAVGGLDALTRGEDVGSNAAIGASIGGVAPGAGRLVGSAAAPVIEVIRGVRDAEGSAARRVASALNTGRPMSAQEIAEAEAAGHPIMPLDYSEGTRALARSAANTSPEARDIFNEAVNNRFEAQANRFEDYLNSTFHYPDPIAQQEAQHAAYRESTAPAYKKAYEEGDRPLWSPELQRLLDAPMIKDALNGAQAKWKNYAVRDGYGAMKPSMTMDDLNRIIANPGGGLKAYPNLQMFDYAARELQDAARNAAPGTQQAGLYNDLARSLKNELDRLVPSYKDARETALDYFDARDAMQAGVNYATSRKVFDNNRARLALAQMTDAQRKLFQDGFVGAYIDKIRSMSDRSNVAGKIMNSPNAREQMEIALGRQRADELHAFTKVENLMDLGRKAVQGNSSTARQLFELGLAGGAGTLMSDNPLADPESFLKSALIYGALRHGGKALSNAVNQKVAAQVAKLLTSDDNARVRTALKMIAQRPDLSSAIQRAASVIARGSESATEWRH
jgi:hypothetical protein